MPSKHSGMKKLFLFRIILSTLGVVAPFNAAATSPDTDRAVRKALDRFIISPPQHGDTKLYGAVVVEIGFDCSGRVTVLSLEGTNPELEAHVAARLGRIHLPNYAVSEKTYTWRFVFKPQQA